MRCLPRIVLLVALVAVMPVLAGCENFDPDSMDLFGLNSKKKLPGKRELLFPSGVPGVTQGIPPEYQAGYKPPGSDDLSLTGTETQPAGANAAAAAKSTAKTAKRAPVEPVRQSNLAKPKPRHVVKRKPKPKPAATAAKPAPQQTAAQPQGTQAPWPSTPPQQTQSGWPAPAQDQKLAPWPSAPPSGTFSK